MAEEDALLIGDLRPTCAANVISRNHVDGWQGAVPQFRVIGGGMHVPVDVDNDETPEGKFRGKPRPFG